jgi:hypothetical protein
MATALQIIGLAAITAGALVLSIPVGLIIGGVIITAIGYALGR